ncbi:MAG: phenylacetate--CoA ligase family protein [Thermoplasmata archaeon]|nr:phenylacetate--CoA ligase family protein [Thermoplasmata archaeon]
MLRKIYHKSPEPVKNVIRRVHSKIPFPYVYGLKFAKYYKWLMKTQWLPPEELEELQNKMLQIIIKHAYENVPYYRRIFDERGLKPEDIQTKEDLKLLPVLTKDDVRRHFNELIAKNVSKYGPYAFESGGTTGKPLKFYKDRTSSFVHSAAVWRYRNWAGYRYGKKWVIMRYETFTGSNQKIPYRVEGNTMYLSSFHLKYENVGDYLSIIEKFNPEAIWAFPSMLYIMAKYIDNQGSKFKFNLKAIFTSSETLFEHQRKLIEEAFDCKIYDWYGSNEGIISAAECPEGNYHITEEGIIEIVDYKNNICSVRESGKVVGTSLWNYAMPFIRYELGDIASFSNKKCKCGRNLPLLGSVEGRIDDIIVTKDGRLVGRLDEAFHYSFGIRESQIIQHEIGKIIVKIVRDVTFSNKDIEILDKELKKRLGNDMQISYEFVDEIPKTRRGKYRFVISKVIKDYLENMR